MSIFLDEAVVDFTSGRGGSGAVSFHREKYVPQGGPNGADGGRGGDVTLIADRHKRTLYDFQLRDHIEATNGEHGMGNKRGKNGKGVEVKVPVGTVVTDVETGNVLVDFTENGEKYVICEGGKGGFGNQHYTSSVRQAPNFAQKGAPAEHVRAKLELKLLADVALIGLPNAGKSTLISRISAARPKIADYPFTTIVPNLGVVFFRDTSFVVADMPGLIEGAHSGVGLGHQFLKHVERSRVLVHVVDARPVDESDPWANYELIENELKLYSEEIWSRPRIIALNKIDLLSKEELGQVKEKFSGLELPLFPISGVTGIGLEPLQHSMIDTLEQAMPIEMPTITPVLKHADDLAWTVTPVADGFNVEGKRIEKLVAMTDTSNREALTYMHRRLQRIGLINKLREMGAQDGDTVRVGELEFAFTEEV